MREQTPPNSGQHHWLTMPILPILVATLGCLPLLYVHFQQLWSRPHYQYFPLILGSVAILINLRRTDPEHELIAPRPFLAGSALVLSLGLATYAVLRISPLLCCMAWLIGLIAYVARSPINTWPAWGLLLFLLRLPQGRDVKLIQWLQKITTQISSVALDKLQIDHIQDGNVLTLPDRQLFVEEACSGVVSLFTILATASIFAAFLRRSAPHTLLLLVAGAFWAAAANILRVVLIAVFIERMGIDLTSGWPHDILGMAIFTLTLITLFSTDYFLRFLVGPINTDETISGDTDDDNPLIRLWNLCFWPARERPAGLLSERPSPAPHSGGGIWVTLVVCISTGFLALGVLQVWGGIGPFSINLGVREQVDSLSRDSLPKQLAGWTLTDFRREERSASSEFGERSRQWTYRRGSRTAIVSIDYPFPEWHDLDVCYRGVGWTLDGKAKLADGTTAIQCPLSKNDQTAQLIYDLFDQFGAPYQSPAGQGIHPRWRRLLSGDTSHWSLPTYYQVQILATTKSNGLSQATANDEYRQLFVEFREIIRQQIISSQTGGAK